MKYESNWKRFIKIVREFKFGTPFTAFQVYCDSDLTCSHSTVRSYLNILEDMKYLRCERVPGDENRYFRIFAMPENLDYTFCKEGSEERKKKRLEECTIKMPVASLRNHIRGDIYKNAILIR